MDPVEIHAAILRSVRNRQWAHADHQLRLMRAHLARNSGLPREVTTDRAKYVARIQKLSARVAERLAGKSRSGW